MNIRIFFSSPGDVKMERETAKRIVDRLQSEIGGNATIDPYFWEHEAMVATKDYQENIPQMDDFDIVVCILWSRLGTPLDPDRHPRPGGGGFASGTEYEFVTAMQAHELKGTPDIFVFRNTTEPRRPSRPKEVREAVDNEIDRLDTFFDEYFQDDTFFTRAINIYSTLGEFEEKLTIALRSYITGRIPSSPRTQKKNKPTYHRQPYLGLAAFDYDDAPVFFGRTAQVGEIITAFQTQEMEAASSSDSPPKHFVLILGSSGSGKSSLARAGVMPMLSKPGVIEGANAWRIAMFKPADVPGDPILALVQALNTEHGLPELFGDGTTPKEIADLIRTQPQGGGLLLRQALNQASALALTKRKEELNDKLDLLKAEHRDADAEQLRDTIDNLQPPAVRIAFLADQLEELFTSDLSPETLDTFIGILTSLANSGRIYVLATLRSDFYPRCLEHPALISLMQGSGTYGLPSPSAADIGQMIRQPAAIAGLEFEENTASGENLDELLRDEALKDSAALPLLSYTLEQLYEQRTENDILTLEAYKNLGGLEGAIGSRAETVFTDLPSQAQGAFDPLCKQLVTLQEGGEPTRRRASYATVTRSADSKTLVDALVSARLLTADQSPSGERIISVAHEALLRHWPRLVSWVDNNRLFLDTRTRIASRISEWTEKNKSDDYLIPRGPNLSTAESILAGHLSSLDPLEVVYIEKSIARVREYDQKKLRTARMITAGAVVLCLIAVAGGIVAMLAKREAQANEAQAKEARSDAQEAAEEAVAAKDKAIAGEARTAYILGVESLEAGKTSEGLLALSQTLAINPEHSGAIDRLYSQHLYGLPKAVPIRSVAFDAGDTQARQRISGALIGPDQLVAYLGNEKSVEVFDLVTRKVVPGPWEEEPDSFASVITNRSETVWNIRKDFSTRIFNVETGEATKVLQSNRDFSQLAINSSGSLFFEALLDGMVRVYDTSDGSLVRSWRQEGGVNYITEDSSSRYFISVSPNEIIIYDSEKNVQTKPIPADENYQFALTFPAIEKPFFATYQTHTTDQWRYAKKITIHSSETGEKIPLENPILTTDWVSSMVFSSSTDTLFLAMDSGEVLPVSLPSGEKKEPIQLPASVGKLALSPDDRLLVTSTLDGTVRIHDLDSRKLAFDPISHDSPLEDLGISWDGRYILTATKTHARIWDLAVGPAVNLTIDVPSLPWSQGVDVETNQFIASTAEGYRKFDLSDMSPDTEMTPNFDTATGTMISVDASMVAEYREDDTIAFRDTRADKFNEDPPVWNAGPESGFWLLSHDGRQFFWIEGDQLTVVNTADGKQVGEITTLSAPSTGVFSGTYTNEFMATVIQPGDAFQNGNEIEIINIENRSSQIFEVKGINMEGLTISPDGRKLAAIGRYIGQANEYSIYLWDLDDPNSEPAKMPCRESVYQLIFSKDGSHIAVRTRDQAIKVWETATVKRAAKPIVISNSLPYFCTFSPDGSRIAILCHKNLESTAQVWDWKEQVPVTRSFRIPAKAFVLYYNKEGTMLSSMWPDPLDDSGSRHLLGQWEVSPKEGISELLTTLSEFATAEKVDARGATTPCDPFVSWQKVAKIDSDSWFTKNPTNRTISPASEATTIDWLNYPNTPFATLYSAMPAVGLIHASIAKWRQNDINNKIDYLASLDPEEDSVEYENIENIILDVRARVNRLVELAERNSYNNPDVHHALATQASAADDRKRAISLLRHAIVIKPDHKLSLELIGLLLEADRDFGAAAEYFGKYHRLYPNESENHAKYAINLWKAGKEDAAHREFPGVLEKDGISNIDRAVILLFNDKPEEAFGYFNKAAKALEKDDASKSDQVDALIYRITADFYIDNMNAAIEHYRKIIAVEPSAARHENLQSIFLGEEIRIAMEKTLILTLDKYPELDPPVDKSNSNESATTDDYEIME